MINARISQHKLQFDETEKISLQRIQGYRLRASSTRR